MSFDRPAARVPCGGFDASVYLPVRIPIASGDHTTLPGPYSWHVGNTSGSTRRHSALYCGWFDTGSAQPRARASIAADAIWAAVHSLTPQYRILHARTM